MDISEQDRVDRKKDFLSFFDLYELKDTLMEDIKTMIHHKQHRLIINFVHFFHHRVQKGPDGYDLSHRLLQNPSNYIQPLCDAITELAHHVDHKYFLRNSMMLTEFGALFMDLQRWRFNIDWLLHHLNYIQKLHQLHAIDSRIDNAKGKLQDMLTLFAMKMTDSEIVRTVGTSHAATVSYIGDGVLTILIPNNVFPLNKEANAPIYTPEDISIIKKIADRDDTFELLSNSLAPSIYGHS